MVQEEVANVVGRGAAEWMASSPVVLQVDLGTFGRNLYLIIGGLIFLALVFFFVLALVIGIKMCLFFAGRRRAQARHLLETRRADGQMYPPFIEGVCEVCKRGGSKIYFPQGAAAMCALCYENWWPENNSLPASDSCLRTSTLP